MGKIIIHSGWFFGAGSIYGWASDGHHRFGVGFPLVELKRDGELTVNVGGLDYVVDRDKAREFVKQYRSVEMRKGTKLAIISKSLCKLTDPILEQKPLTAPKTPKKEKDLTLF